jgi:hypothetical protein
MLASAVQAASASDKVLCDFTRNLDLPPPVVAADAVVSPTKSPGGSFDCDDSHATYAELSARGVPFEGRPTKELWCVAHLFSLALVDNPDQTR